MRISVKVCDVCEDTTRETVTYRITNDGRAVSVDLCAEHRAPIEALLAGQPIGKADSAAGKGKDQPATRRDGNANHSLQRGDSSRIMTMAEIEALKQ